MYIFRAPARIEAVRREANQVLAECYQRQFPIAWAVVAVRLLISRENLPQPPDVLAWASNGKINSEMVTDWESAAGD